MWSTNHHCSVLLHCWFGHFTSKIISEMTYNVSNGTCESTAAQCHNSILSIINFLILLLLNSIESFGPVKLTTDYSIIAVAFLT